MPDSPIFRFEVPNGPWIMSRPRTTNFDVLFSAWGTLSLDVETYWPMEHEPYKEELKMTIKDFIL